MPAKFRLATLLKIRESERDIAGRDVQDALLAMQRMDEAKQEIDRTNREMDQVRKRASIGQMSLTQLLDAQRYQMVLAAQAAHIEANKSQLQQELTRRQAKLLKCQQAVKSLEKLRDNRIAAAEQMEFVRDQNRLDEWSATQSAIRMQSVDNSCDLYRERP
jgi:flagellar export protein FliJ